MFIAATLVTTASKHPRSMSSWTIIFDKNSNLITVGGLINIVGNSKGVSIGTFPIIGNVIEAKPN